MFEIKNIASNKQENQWLVQNTQRAIGALLPYFPTKTLRTLLFAISMAAASVGCNSKIPTQIENLSQVYTDNPVIFDGHSGLVTGQGFPMWAQSIQGTMGDIRFNFHPTDKSVGSIPFNHTYALPSNRYAIRLDLSVTSAATIEVQLQDDLGNYLSPISLNVTPAQTNYYVYGAQVENHTGIRTISAVMPAGSNSLVVYQADLLQLNAVPTFSLGVPFTGLNAGDYQLLSIPVNWDLTASNLQRTFVTVDVSNANSIANSAFLQYKIAGLPDNNPNAYKRVPALPVTAANNSLVFPIPAALQYEKVQLIHKPLSGSVTDTLIVGDVNLVQTSASFATQAQIEFNETTNNPATPQVLDIPFVYNLAANGVSTNQLMFEVDLQRTSGTINWVQLQFIDSNNNYHPGPVVPVTGALSTARVLASDIKTNIADIKSVQITTFGQSGQMQASARVKHLTTPANSFLYLPVPTSTSFKTTLQPTGLTAPIAPSDQLNINITGGSFQGYVWVNGVRSNLKTFNGDGSDFAFMHPLEFPVMPTGPITSVVLEIENPGVAKNLELRSVTHTNAGGGTLKETVYAGGVNAAVKGTGNSNRIYVQDGVSAVVYPQNQSGATVFGVVYGSSLGSLTNLSAQATTLNANLFGSGLYTSTTFGSNLITNNFSATSPLPTDLDQDGIRLVYPSSGTELLMSDINASVTSTTAVATGGKNNNSIDSFFSGVFNSTHVQQGGAIALTEFYGNNPTVLQGTINTTYPVTTAKTLQTIDGYISQTRLDGSNNPNGKLDPVIINTDTVTTNDNPNAPNILMINNGNLRLQATGQLNLIDGDGNRVFGVMPVGRKLKIANDPNYPPVNDVSYSEVPLDLAQKNYSQIAFNLQTSGSVDIKVSAVVGSNGNYRTVLLGTISGASYNGAFTGGVISLTPIAGENVYDFVFDVVSPGNAPGAVNGTADFKKIELK